jgi:hypothetical protein
MTQGLSGDIYFIYIYFLSYINLAFDYVVVMSFTSNVIKLKFFVGARH